MNVTAFIWTAFIIIMALVSFHIWWLDDSRRHQESVSRLKGRIFEQITEAQKRDVAATEAKVIENSDPIHILFEVSNSELRQSMIAKHGGFEALLAKTKHDIIHTDDFGVLFRVLVGSLGKHFYYVKVINGTMEDDGSFREYYKEVPPDMDTAKEAVAWTYGLHPDDYQVFLRT